MHRGTDCSTAEKSQTEVKKQGGVQEHLKHLLRSKHSRKPAERRVREEGQQRTQDLTFKIKQEVRGNPQEINSEGSKVWIQVLTSFLCHSEVVGISFIGEQCPETDRQVWVYSRCRCGQTHR